MSIVKSKCPGLKLEVFMLHLCSFNSPGKRTSHLNCFDIVGDERCWHCEDWNVANSGVRLFVAREVDMADSGCLTWAVQGCNLPYYPTPVLAT